MKMNRREAERHATIGLISSLWDGKSICIGVIENVSMTGVMVSQIPYHFVDAGEKCSSIVHGPYSDFNMHLRPCWHVLTNRGMYKMIGFRIDKPPVPWRALVRDRNELSDFFQAMPADSEEVTV